MAVAPDLCPLCGARLDPGRGFAVDGCSYARCPECHAHVVIPLPLPLPEALGAYYREAYYATFGLLEAGPRRQAMLRRLLAQIPRRPPGRFLDVGCGGGHLLALARAAGWEVAGVDPSADGCARARAQYGLQVEAAPLEAAALAEASFDVVTLVNVLDQAPDPLALLRAARRALRPRGLLIARVPNGDFHRAAWGLIRRLPPPAARRLRRLLIFHPICLNARALRALLARAGLGHVRIGNAPISGAEWSVPQGVAGRAALACLTAVARAGAGAAEGVTFRRVLCGPSLLGLAEREAG